MEDAGRFLVAPPCWNQRSPPSVDPLQTKRLHFVGPPDPQSASAPRSYFLGVQAKAGELRRPAAPPGSHERVRADARARFGANIRDERRRRSLSQDALARACRLHRTEISLLERGAREPRLSTIVRLARALDVAPGGLLAGVD